MAEIMVQYDDGKCAVGGCEADGRPQVCIYDSRYHRHGKIHYVNAHPFHPALWFKDGPWCDVCNPHYAEMKAGAEALRQERLA